MLINDLIEKSEKIDELKVYQIANFKGMFRYSVCTDNQDIVEYLQNIIENIDIDDVYRIDNRRWIRKSIVDDFIRDIKEAKSYREIADNIYGYDFVTQTYVTDERGVATEAVIKFTSTTLGLAIKKAMIRLLSERCDKVLINPSINYGIAVKHMEVDEREECLHRCRTEYRKRKINEVLGL